jgi:CelD/BcsL family acetyltransferase involved in cellulose biosynthesis
LAVQWRFILQQAKVTFDHITHPGRVLAQSARNIKTINNKRKEKNMNRKNKPKTHAGQENITQPRSVQEQGRAVRNFIESWNLSMPYHDIGAALNCGETNALHQMLVAFGATQAAQALMQAHVAGDDEGDDPEHVRIKAELESQDHPLK